MQVLQDTCHNAQCCPPCVRKWSKYVTYTIHMGIILASLLLNTHAKYIQHLPALREHAAFFSSGIYINTTMANCIAVPTRHTNGKRR